MQRFVSDIKRQGAYCLWTQDHPDSKKTYSYVFTFIFLGAGDVPEGKQGDRDQLRESGLSFQPIGSGA